MSAILVKIPPQIRRARGAQGLADGKADEGSTRHFAGHEDQDDEHHDELDADQEHADAHAGGQRDVEQLHGLAFKRGKGHAGIGQGVHADAEPGHAVGPEDADDGPGQDQENVLDSHVLQEAEIVENAGADKDEQDEK